MYPTPNDEIRKNLLISGIMVNCEIIIITYYNVGMVKFTNFNFLSNTQFSLMFLLKEYYTFYRKTSKNRQHLFL